MSWTRQSAELQRGLANATHEPLDQLPVAVAAATPVWISRRHVVWGFMGFSLYRGLRRQPVFRVTVPVPLLIPLWARPRTPFCRSPRSCYEPICSG